ncbi:hypothetical protein GIY23_20040 [Allosaccharopolyspora coralli]|uniref:PPE domain-containing protein n=1 Tax=Allosaccharopolyspora coralli TaxID=2665642 RepID=A0A5Q3QDQ0_9PSEU|nr:hypothetical protein [Allosaccharopolyspora coralli]QGK71496.1 hypothetical protein GIY23_20040 [Allosaccharopolyspora coralli]
MAPEPVDAFGGVGRSLGASDAYERVSRALLDETGRLGERWFGDVGLASNDVVDAIREWADALDRAAEALRIVGEKFADHVAETAENVSAAVVPGVEQGRVRRLLLDAEEPARELVRSAENVVRDFVRFCDEFDSGRGVSEQTPLRSASQHAYGSPAPQSASARQEGASGSEAVSASTGSGAPSVGGADGVSPVDAESSCSQFAECGRPSPEEVPESPVPAAAAGTGHAGSAAAAVGGTWGGGMVGAMPMAGMMGRNQESPRQNASRLKASPEDLFGKPDHTAPAIFGAPQKRPLE